MLLNDLYWPPFNMISAADNGISISFFQSLFYVTSRTMKTCVRGKSSMAFPQDINITSVYLSNNKRRAFPVRVGSYHLPAYRLCIGHLAGEFPFAFRCAPRILTVCYLSQLIIVVSWYCDKWNISDKYLVMYVTTTVTSGAIINVLCWCICFIFLLNSLSKKRNTNLKNA